MRKWAIYAILGSALMLMACDKKDINSPTPETDTKEIKQDIRNAATKALEKAKQERDEFVAGTEKELQEMDKEIEALKQQLQSLSGAAKDKLQHEVQELEEERKETEQKLAALKAEAVEKWQALKTGVSDAIDHLKEIVQKAKSDAA